MLNNTVTYKTGYKLKKANKSVKAPMIHKKAGVKTNALKKGS